MSTIESFSLFIILSQLTLCCTTINNYKHIHRLATSIAHCCKKNVNAQHEHDVYNVIKQFHTLYYSCKQIIFTKKAKTKNISR